ncbi:hypothetical protein B0H11DRAFT_555597 [Mycena galericulata]|nr:hypothetical protein B0H11DRAFT_555597 [Mycena galericulata]
MATARPMHENTFFRSHLVPNAAQASHLRELLRSQAPLPDQLTSSMMSALSIEIARYDSEISRLRAQIAVLEADQSALKAYHDEHGSFLAPVRRVPSEILVKIFGFLPLSLEDAFDEPPGSSPGEIQISRLVGMPLLAVSLVCARWHDIAVGTPGLWNRINLDPGLWCALNDNPDETQNVMELLTRVLKLGGESLLDVEIWSEGASQAVLGLLANHSERWKTIKLCCTYDDLLLLSSVKGKLPFLENLDIHAWKADSEEGTLDTFGVAPRLRNLSIPGPLLSTIAKPPLEQLHALTCTDLSNLAEIAMAASMLAGLPHESECRLVIDFDCCNLWQISDLDIGPSSSKIVSLSLEMGLSLGTSKADYRAEVLLAIFAALTLPQLQELAFHYTHWGRTPLPWLHTEFLALSARSSFHNHLATLQLHHVILTEAELLECLSPLPSLQRLEIADHANCGPLAVDHHLITDNLLSRLTRSAGSSCLVPHLRFLACTSLLRFDDTVFLNFLLSRIPGDGTFENEMRVIRDHRREFEESAAARIRELCIQKRLEFVFVDERST